MKTTLYKKDVKKVARRLAACCLLLFAMAGNAWAQNSSNPRYVIKKDGHYLSHVKIEATMLDHQGNDSTYWYWVLRDVEAFHPDSCLWYSGPNYEHNYYFVDHEGKYRYLNAPLEKDGEIEISSSHPGTQVLNQTASDYYFYDWDHGAARGVQHYPTPGNPCNPYYNIPSHISQCWEVVWVSYDGGWKMSSIWSYNPTPATNAAPYRNVTVTPHGEEKSGESGGITDLVLGNITLATVGDYEDLNGTASDYTYTLTPAYTLYDIAAVYSEDNVTHAVYFNVPQENHYYYYNSETGTYDNTVPPTATDYTNVAPSSYAWSLTGDEGGYLSLTGANTATPTLTYANQNISNSHEFATLTLTVTYGTGTTQTTQTCSATVTVITQCQNPRQALAPVVTYEDVTVSWLATASKYKVWWKKRDTEWNETNTHVVEDATSYAITTGLEYGTNGTDYDYKVSAYCGGSYQDVPPELIYTFKTKPQPKGLVYGAVFGGGRMADVGGKTEVVIINCDSISAVFGGNDIAGVVQGNDGVDGSAITLGVVSGEYATYGTTSPSIGVRIGDVYGGGNGYYAYNGTSFEPASYNTTYTIEAGASINAMTNQHTVGDPVWTNTTDQEVNFVCPTISKSNIVVNTNYVKIDSVFGGAKNAILNNQTNDVNITVNGGTIYAVFAGNNFGGSLGNTSTENIVINNTKTKTSVSDYNANKLGHDFGIGYVFGGGNKVIGQNAVITVNGGQCDTIFGGGNAADVRSTIVNMQCSVASGSGVTFGNTYSNAISSYNEGVITTKDDYKWNGTGIYNVRTLFGGNNRADMAGLPTLNLTSGSVGTVYGGGNAGNMVAQETDDCTTNHDQLVINGNNVKYGTHVKMDKETMLVDVLYGGCQMSNVNYSTWVEIAGGHVGTVYGGCNISGDVGSTRVNLDATPFSGNVPNPEYQKVYGATYVVASHGTVHQNLFAGSNGYYHCNDGFRYISGLNYADPEERYVGMYIPTHNETYAIIQGDVLVKGNVYAGANLAPVGFTTAYVSHFQSYSSLVGLASVRMSGGTVEGNVFGGGNMASINGSNEVQVSGGSIGYIGDAAIGGALYGGNDRTGQAGQISNRILPDDYKVASDGHTSIEDVRTYVGVTGNPRINTVYGGGNGYYAYFDNIDDYNAYTGPLDKVLSCNPNDLPTQSDIFVDIAIDGSAGTDGTGYIHYVYGGGNGVSVDPNGFLKVFLNVKNFGEDDADHVGTLFGGNNMGDLEIVPNIILLNGKVNTVYGGCNSGAMQGTTIVEGEDGTLYENVGSFVHTRSSYTVDENTVTPTAQVTGYVYGGCRSNGVTHNTLVLVEGGNHPATFFGGSDVSGIVGGTTQVIVKGGSTGDVFGGGNGTGSVTPPYCNYTHVEALGGTCTGDVFGGGLAGPCGETHVTVDRVTVNGTVVDRGTVNGSVFGGGYAGMSGETHVTIADGTVRGSVFGGGNEAGLSTEDLNPDPEITQSFSGNSNILMSGGFVKGEVDPDRFGMGMFGGCNAEGSIAGDVAITLTGGTIGTADARANVHGGGYGQPTTVAGDVLINFGQTMWDESGETPVEIHNENLNLYGDLYGGSALGSVNNDATNTTTIHIDNGTINGNVYGGGLGDAADGTKGWTKGVVHVFVGGENNGSYFGMASFNDCSIFGCNNLNGSPQTDVYVDVYQTAHNEEDVYDTGEEFAIYRVFGGGNQANYAPENNSSSSLKVAHVHIHGCLNTIEEVYGGSNQADAISTHSVVDGGRFRYIFGGGNGLNGPANVGVDVRIHSTFSQVKGGHVAFCFGGSNSQGNCINIVQSFETDNVCDPLVIDNIYNGGNFADQVGEMVLNFSCETPESYKKAYGGCRLGTVYGNITVNVYGGIIGTLYGGCQGEIGQEGEDHPSNVKKYDADHYPDGHPELIGTGGNVTVNLYGGTIGEVYGGCELNGNVEGRISINVYHIENSCGLFIGNIYGASNHTDYTPVDLAEGIASPKVSVIKATVGGDNADLDQTYIGNVFGGGNYGKVTSNPQVVVGESTNTKPVTIKGDVYGGGDNGDINGTTGVIVVPQSHQLTITAPSSGNALRVTDILGHTVTDEASIDEYSDLKLVAMPSVYGQKFTGWTIGGEGATVINNTLVSTTFVMGTEDATITAGFGQTDTYSLTVTVVAPSYGSVSVIDPQGNVVDLDQEISLGAELTLVATPTSGYAFAGWSVDGEGVITSLLSATTTFIVGAGNATITATFLPTHTLTINIVRPENSSVSVSVTDAQGNIINSGDAVREGAILNLVATHAQGYSFAGWSCIGTGSSIGNSSSATTTFTMGSGDATLTATFTVGRAYNDMNSNR